MRTYKASLLQSGTEDPVASVTHSNGFTVAPTFERLGEGQYRINAVGMFDGLTFIQIGNYRSERSDPHAWRISAGRIEDDFCALNQDAFVIDEILTGDGFSCSIEITVED